MDKLILVYRLLFEYLINKKEDMFMAPKKKKTPAKEPQTLRGVARKDLFGDGRRKRPKE